jgi:hypothetical protein
MASRYSYLRFVLVFSSLVLISCLRVYLRYYGDNIQLLLTISDEGGGRFKVTFYEFVKKLST